MSSFDFQSAVARSPLEAALVALIGGILVSLTPCVYPMIAITVSVFGANRARSRLQGAGLSAAFVLGIVAMFTPLGVAAGMSGSLFGAALQNRWVLLLVSAVFLGMAASLFGAFEVALPSSITNRLAGMNALGARGAFGLGLACGLIAAPCTGPVLTGILTWIAQTQSPLGGGLAMLAFSLGLGLPFFIVGTFAVHLPKSGAWMLHIKSVLAMVMAVVGLYYLTMAFPALIAWVRRSDALIWGSLAVMVFGVVGGAVHRDFGSPSLKEKIMKSIGASSTTLAAFTLLTALSAPPRALEWLHVPYEEARALALTEKRPMLVDFTATWCGACKKLDAETFSDPEVMKESQRFVAVKVDATNDEDPRVREVMQKLSVVGLPTVVLLSAEGAESGRFTDFVPPSTMLGSLQAVR